ncbi:MAG: tyrosine-type recombinase/integrase [Bacteroides sp.]|nr:tyrosine-type recombinase/integrase [Bacteroides sp.]MBD5307365.1 tyrosine-type recombinase/integrase [Bacteroides sp.]
MEEEFEKSVGNFLEYMLLERNRSRLTCEAYGRDLRQLGDYLEQLSSDITPRSITTRDLRGWLADNSSRGNAPRSLRRKAQSIRSYFAWMVLTGRRPDNPAASLKLAKGDKPLPSFVGEEEMERIARQRLSQDPVLEIRNHLIVELLYSCGLRQAELLTIRDRDLNFDRGEMRIHGKGGKTRIIPIAPETIEVITNWKRIRDKICCSPLPPAGQRPLFPGRFGEPISRSRLYQIVREALIATSAHRRSPHTLRHSFATAMLNGGADIASVKEFLGHSSLSSTQIYTHLNFRELQRDYRAAHPRATDNTVSTEDLHTEEEEEFGREE